MICCNPDCDLATPVFFVQCEECVEGEVWVGRWHGDWSSPPEDIYERCSCCGGLGDVVSEEPPTITLQELQWVDEEIAEAVAA